MESTRRLRVPDAAAIGFGLLCLYFAADWIYGGVVREQWRWQPFASMLAFGACTAYACIRRRG